MDLCQFLPFFHHGIGFEADDFCTDRPIHDLANLDEHFLKAAPFLRDKGRIRGHSIKKSEAGRLLDFLHIGCIEKEFHGFVLSFQDEKSLCSIRSRLFYEELNLAAIICRYTSVCLTGLRPPVKIRLLDTVSSPRGSMR